MANEDDIPDGQDLLLDDDEIEPVMMMDPHAAPIRGIFPVLFVINFVEFPEPDVDVGPDLFANLPWWVGFVVGNGGDAENDVVDLGRFLECCEIF